jgi:hypothetical protein
VGEPDAECVAGQRGLLRDPILFVTYALTAFFVLRFFIPFCYSADSYEPGEILSCVVTKDFEIFALHRIAARAAFTVSHL